MTNEIAGTTRRIIAIGGGKVRIPKPQTTLIDREIVRLSAKKRPRLLFVPTASSDDPEYCAAIERHFGGRLGCHVETLLLYRNRPDARETAQRIRGSDIIYVGGGNTLRMMRLWRRLGIDSLLQRAACSGTVLAGLSAGAICWFHAGNSDSRKFANARNKTLIRVNALNLVDALVCPHYDSEPHRQPALKAMMRKTPGVAIALEDCSAIEIVDDAYRIIASRRGRFAYRVFWELGKYYRQRLRPHEDFRSLRDLLSKSIDNVRRR